MSLLSRLSCKGVLHQIKATHFRVVAHLVSHRSSYFYLHQRGYVFTGFIRLSDCYQNNSTCYKWISVLHLFFFFFLHTRLNLVTMTCWVIWQAGDKDWLTRSGSTSERLPAVVKIRSHSPLCCVLPGSCQTSIRTERWLWMSSALPSIWLWPERTATTSPRSCLRAWCQS